jgi:hypothetical protein
MLATELDRANGEIQRLKKMLKRPSDGSDVSNLSTGSSQMNQPAPAAVNGKGNAGPNGSRRELERPALMFFGEESPPPAAIAHLPPSMVKSVDESYFHVFSANQ